LEEGWKEKSEMTHSLHRKGDQDELRDDFVMLVMAGRDRMAKETVRQRMTEVWNILSRYEAELSNFGTLNGGGRHRKPIAEFRSINPWIIHAIFSNRDQLAACLAELKKRDLGISVAVSGCCEDVMKAATNIDLTPHTIHYSLGIHGKVEKLPSEQVLAITTMCGHAMVSGNLVADLVTRIDKGKMTHAAAAQKLCDLCDCGIFNKHKAERLLREMV
jgi:hypothetical protein